MSPFKNKFTIDPQLDSEGFEQLDAACRGCRPEDSCPRSGHCERYDSPLRYNIAEDMRINAILEQHGINPRCEGCNPKGWDEIDGVKLPSVSPWAQLEQSHLDIVHGLWATQRIEPVDYAQLEARSAANDTPYDPTLNTGRAECPRSDRCANEHVIECGCIATGEHPHG